MMRSFVQRFLPVLAVLAFLSPVPSQAFLQGRYMPAAPPALSVPVLPTAANGSDLPAFCAVPEGEFTPWKSCRNDPVSFNDPMGLQIPTPADVAFGIGPSFEAFESQEKMAQWNAMKTAASVRQGRIIKGMVTRGPRDFVLGTWNLLRHPIKGGQGMANAVIHYDETAKRFLASEPEDQGSVIFNLYIGFRMLFRKPYSAEVSEPPATVPPRAPTTGGTPVTPGAAPGTTLKPSTSCPDLGIPETPTTKSAGGAADEMVTVYRGVHAEHPQLPNALRGSAEPIGGHSNPLWHNQGDNASVFTSWSTERSVAEWFAAQRGPGGVILEQTVPRSSLVTSPDVLGEFEVLRVGPINGATPTVLGR